MKSSKRWRGQVSSTMPCHDPPCSRKTYVADLATFQGEVNRRSRRTVVGNFGLFGVISDFILRSPSLSLSHATATSPFPAPRPFHIMLLGTRPGGGTSLARILVGHSAHSPASTKPPLAPGPPGIGCPCQEIFFQWKCVASRSAWNNRNVSLA